MELYTRDNSMTWEATFSPPGEGAEAGVGAGIPGERRVAGLTARARGPAASWRPPVFEPLSLWGCSGRLPGGGEEAASTWSPDHERTACLREATLHTGLGFRICNEDRHSVTAQSGVTGTLPGAYPWRWLLLRPHPRRSSSDNDYSARGGGGALGTGG